MLKDLFNCVCDRVDNEDLLIGVHPEGFVYIADFDNDRYMVVEKMEDVDMIDVVFEDFEEE